MAEPAKHSMSWKCWDSFAQLSNSVRFIGCNVMDFDDRAPLNIYTYITMFLNVVLALMGVNYMWLYSNNMKSIAEAMFTVTLSLQAATKIYMIISDIKTVIQVVIQVVDFVHDFEDNPRVCSIFQRYVNICNWWRPNIFRFYTFLISGLSVGCIILAVVTKTKILHLGGVLPFINHETNAGYIVNFAVYIIISFYGAYGYFASDYSYLNTMAMACAQIETIAVVCKDLTNVFGRERIW
uniref:Uncharacterized protein n=1 Tax=Phlebotomus papatasi TaxID=29031 RepID=A0A3F2ZEA4_PHLPP